MILIFIDMKTSTLAFNAQSTLSVSICSVKLDISSTCCKILNYFVRWHFSLSLSKSCSFVSRHKLLLFFFWCLFRWLENGTISRFTSIWSQSREREWWREYFFSINDSHVMALMDVRSTTSIELCQENCWKHFVSIFDLKYLTLCRTESSQVHAKNTTDRYKWQLVFDEILYYPHRLRIKSNP